jgi:hypothetical protein
MHIVTTGTPGAKGIKFFNFSHHCSVAMNCACVCAIDLCVNCESRLNEIFTVGGGFPCQPVN